MPFLYEIRAFIITLPQIGQYQTNHNMKKYLLLAIACVLGLFNLNAQKTVTIGDGDEASSVLPYDNSWCYSASQQIYSTDELNFNGAGSALVKSIAFKSATENNNENYIQVYMVNHNNKNFTDTLLLRKKELVEAIQAKERQERERKNEFNCGSR